jgi:hypothetical protein
VRVSTLIERLKAAIRSQDFLVTVVGTVVGTLVATLLLAALSAIASAMLPETNSVARALARFAGWLWAFLTFPVTFPLAIVVPIAAWFAAWVASKARRHGDPLAGYVEDSIGGVIWRWSRRYGKRTKPVPYCPHPGCEMQLVPQSSSKAGGTAFLCQSCKKLVANTPMSDRMAINDFVERWIDKHERTGECINAQERIRQTREGLLREALAEGAKRAKEKLA